MAGPYLISPEELLALLKRPGSMETLRIVDARFELADPAYGDAAYAAGTIPGAVRLDLDRHMSSSPAKHGGRHPLPDMDVFAATLGSLGIGRDSDVVVFDDGGSMYAARAWWLLRYAGMERVRFLDGGLGAFLAAGGELASPPASPAEVAFELALRPGMVVGVGEVERSLHEPGFLLLDARSPERYRGDAEPLDPKAGHIPGALNRYYQANLEGGRFANPEALRERLAPAGEAATVVAYCGSGVSGAHLLLALALAGYPDAKLYAGSWSDWASYDLPVATGSEEA